MTPNALHARTARSSESGFTLIELLVSVGILMVISSLVLRGTLDMSRLNAQQANRSEMHAGLRNATALLQQEVGQAGRIAFFEPVVLTNDIGAGPDQWAVVTPATALAAMFPGERLVITKANNEEIVTVLAVGTASFKANFMSAHLATASIRPAGGFAEGIIPRFQKTNTGATIDYPNGSRGNVLKILGDINGDGTLMYVEYTCTAPTAGTPGRMYRNMMAYNATVKPALTIEQVLLDNLLDNPPDPDGTVRPCFTYEWHTIGTHTYVINVAITTTVRTDERDRMTGDFQRVTKALLNVAPRNVFNVWQIASFGYDNRIQPMPETVVTSLLP